MNKVLAVVKSLTYQTIMTTGRASFSVAVMWAISSCLVVLAVISEETGILWLQQFTRYFIVLFVFLTIVSNIFLYKKSRDHRRAIRAQIQAVQTGQISQHDFRAIKAILIVSGTFALGWLPLSIAMLYTDSSEDYKEYYIAVYFTFPFTLINAVLDPLIYFFRSDQFKLFYQRQKRRFLSSRGLDLPVTPAAPPGPVIPNKVHPINVN